MKKSFQMRNENEEIFLERDPMSDISQRYFEAAAFVPLPKLTKEGHKVFLWKMLNADKVSDNNNELKFSNSSKIHKIKSNISYSYNKYKSLVQLRRSTPKYVHGI